MIEPTRGSNGSAPGHDAHATAAIVALAARLEVGRGLKAKGIATPSGLLLAMELEPCERRPRVRITGRIQAFDWNARTLRLLGHDLSIAPGVVATTPEGGVLDLARLTPGAGVRIEAVPDGGAGWTIGTIRLRDRRDFVIEKLEGAIDAVDVDRALLTLAGFRVRLDPGTVMGDER